jgi:hypothetical protein
MTNVLVYTKDTYLKHLGLVLLFSLSFIIALAIPIFASLPTYNDIGAIFVRTSSIFVNLTIVSTALIVASILFSLLFLSFAIVAINVIVKHSRTQVRVRKDVIDGIEKYTSRVFLILFFYTIILMVANILTYLLVPTGIISNLAGIVTAIVGIVFAPLFFYAPSVIVIDDSKIMRSMKLSFKFFFKRFDYFILWLLLALAILTLFDFIFITVSGTLISRYALLVFDSLFVLPFFVMLQSECYMKRFALLKR